jgi:hypothetical protein
LADWIADEYPDDVTVMYEGAGQNRWRLDQESIPLWEKHTRDDVAANT